LETKTKDGDLTVGEGVHREICQIAPKDVNCSCHLREPSAQTSNSDALNVNINHNDFVKQRRGREICGAMQFCEKHDLILVLKYHNFLPLPVLLITRNRPQESTCALQDVMTVF